MPRVSARTRLILALDVPSANGADQLLARVGDAVEFVKVGLELFAAAGPQVVKMALGRSKRVFLDLKFLDIQETVRRATAQVAELGADFLTVHANRKALRAAVEARNGSPSHAQLRVLAVTVLTNLDAEDLQEMGTPSTVDELVVARAKLAAEMGCDGVVASGVEATAIRKELGPDFLIVTPGIRPAETAHDEHARVTTPAAAIRAGADYLVVGRPIRDAADPKAATDAIVTDMQAAFDARTS